MNNNSGKFVTGMVTGVVVGATTALVVNPMINKNKKSRNRNQHQTHMLKNVGDTMSNVVDSFRSNMK